MWTLNCAGFAFVEITGIKFNMVIAMLTFASDILAGALSI